jgi:hypothetical protein
MATSEQPPLEEYITERGLKRRYDISPRTAQRWRVSGGGPPWIRLGRRRVIYRIRDIEAWLAARTYCHRADELSRDGQGGDDGN